MMDKSKKEMADLKRDLATAQRELSEARDYIRRRILAEADHARKVVAERTSKTDALARRAAACKHWRWVPGMLVDGIRIDGTCHFVAGLGKPWRKEDFREMICDECLPDLSDPATLGCLIALVREAYEDEWTRELSSFFDATAMGWRVGVILKGTALIPYAKGCSLLPFENEAEALVSALEGAP